MTMVPSVECVYPMLEPFSRMKELGAFRNEFDVVSLAEMNGEEMAQSFLLQMPSRRLRANYNPWNVEFIGAFKSEPRTKQQPRHFVKDPRGPAAEMDSRLHLDACIRFTPPSSERSYGPIIMGFPIGSRWNENYVSNGDCMDVFLIRLQNGLLTHSPSLRNPNRVCLRADGGAERRMAGSGAGPTRRNQELEQYRLRLNQPCDKIAR